MTAVECKMCSGRGCSSLQAYGYCNWSDRPWPSMTATMEMKRPTPQPDYKDALKRLLEALVRQCDQADSLDMNAGVTTQWIRQLVKKHSPRENTDLRSRDKP